MLQNEFLQLKENFVCTYVDCFSLFSYCSMRGPGQFMEVQLLSSCLIAK